MKGYICSFCTSNKTEDENHFLLDCKAYSQIRDILGPFIRGNGVFDIKAPWKIRRLDKEHENFSTFEHTTLPHCQRPKDLSI